LWLFLCQPQPCCKEYSNHKTSKQEPRCFFCNFVTLLFNALVVDERNLHSGKECVKETEVKMLVLSRRKDETVLVKVPGLGEDIEITIVQIDSSRVRVGFKAPPNVAILRQELQKKQEVVKS
jgi:carbon storage regulator